MRKSGTTVLFESNPATYAEDAITLASESLLIRGDNSTDKQITHMRFYRTLTDGATYYYDGEVAIVPYDEDLKYSYTYTWELSISHAGADDHKAFTTTGNYEATYAWEPDLETSHYGTSTTHNCEPVYYDSAKADTALGTELETDHDRPPLGTIVAGPAYNGYCLIAKDNLLYFCKANRPEYWPSDYYIEVGPMQFPLKAIEFYNGVAYAFSSREVYMVQGTGFNSFFPYPMSAKTGTFAQDCVLSIKGKGIYHVAQDGIYLFTSTDDMKISQDRFDPIFRGETVGSVPGMNLDAISNCWLAYWQNKIYFGYPSGNETYPNSILVLNMLTDKATYFEYPTSFITAAVDYQRDILMAVDDEGYVWHLEDPDNDTDYGTVISWDIESKQYTDQVRRYFPREARYDIELSFGASATAVILLDDEVKQTHSINTSRQTRKRLITECNGNRLAVRVSGTGGIRIREVEIQ